MTLKVVDNDTETKIKSAMNGLVDDIFFSNARDYVGAFVDAKEIKLKDNLRFVDNTGRELSENAVNDMMLRDYAYQFSRFVDIKLFKRSDKIADRELTREMDEFLFQAKENHLKTLANKLKGTDEDLETLSAFVRAITGHENKVDVYVLAHWIQNIKRRLLGLPARNHMMPVVVGKQGCGKSVALNKLVSVLGSYDAGDVDLRGLLSANDASIVSERYTGVINELRNFDKADIESVKGLITMEKMNLRQAYSRKSEEYQVTISLMGTSNVLLSDVISDATGVRRFYEILVKTDKCDWGIINALDYVKLWQGISLTRDYLYDVKKDLEALQEELRYKTPTELFCEDEDVKPGTYEAPLKDIYDVYCQWCIDNGIRPLGMQGKYCLTTEMKKLGFEVIRATRHGKQMRYILVQEGPAGQ